MDTILNAFKEAFFLIFTFNPEFYRVVLLSVVVSGSATVIGALIGFPVGVALHEFRFRGRRPLLVLVHAFMGLPPVVLGVFAVLLLSRSAPLGFLDLIYTPTAMVLVQVLLAAPIIAGFTNASLEEVDPRLGLQARSLGATRLQSVFVEMREARAGLVAALIAGFGGVISEVGAVMMVGGNIKNETRVMTTDIVLQMRQGKAEMALAEGLVLILIAIIVNIFFTRLQAERGRSEVEKRGVTGAYIGG